MLRTDVQNIPTRRTYMPAYKYETSEGKNLWYCSFHYIDWMGQKSLELGKFFYDLTIFV
jgi:hypothetical protein